MSGRSVSGWVGGGRGWGDWARCFGGVGLGISLGFAWLAARHTEVTINVGWRDDQSRVGAFRENQGDALCTLGAIRSSRRCVVGFWGNVEDSVRGRAWVWMSVSDSTRNFAKGVPCRRFATVCDRITWMAGRLGQLSSCIGAWVGERAGSEAVGRARLPDGCVRRH